MGYTQRVTAASEKLQTRPRAYVFAGDHPGVDFANTFLTINGQETDYLRTWSEVVEWFALSALFDTPLPGEKSDGRPLFSGSTRGRPPVIAPNNRG